MPLPPAHRSRVPQQPADQSSGRSETKRAGLIIVLIAMGLLGLGYFATAGGNETASSEPNELHPNSTSPDEQGESGSLIEHPSGE